MAWVFLDYEDDGRIRCIVQAGIKGRKVKHFTDRDEAVRFAVATMGRRGMVCSTIDHTPEQRAEHYAREVRRAHLDTEAGDA